MIGVSYHQDLGDPRAPIDYALSARVQKRGDHDVLVRDPFPELLHGDPGHLLQAFELLNSKTRVLSLTLSFHKRDIDVGAFNRGDAELRRTVASVVELVLAFANAGIPSSSQLPCVVSTHSHTGRLELNFVLPRGAINARGLARNYNPCPPTALGNNGWDAMRDYLNFSHSWADPFDPARAQIVSGPKWLETEVAAADRAGTVFYRDKPAQMLLQKLRHELQKGADVELLRECRDEILAGLGWTLISETATGCIVGPKSASRGKNILLRGTAFSNRPLPDLQSQIHLRNTVMKNSRARLLDAWTKLAGHNAATLGKGKWPEMDPAVELDAILTSPRLQLPPHHPGFPSPIIESPCSRWTKVADALQAILKRMLERVEAQFHQSRFARFCADLTPRLERVAAALEKRNAQRSAEEYGRAYRAPGQRSEFARETLAGARVLAAERQDRRNDAGLDADRRRAGGNGGNVKRPERDHSPLGSNGFAHEGFDARNPADARLADRPIRGTRADRLREVRRAASEAFPGAAISVRLSRRDAGTECVCLKVQEATVSIDSEGLDLTEGQLDQDRLMKLADGLHIIYRWWDDVVEAEEREHGPNTLPAT